jgi:hypothetical protein
MEDSTGPNFTGFAKEHNIFSARWLQAQQIV